MGVMDKIFKVGSGAVIISYAAMFALVILWTTVIFPEDLGTTKAGYMMIPSRKINGEAVASAVMLIPSLVEIISMYIVVHATSDKPRNMWSIIGVVAFLVDSGTDVFYKYQGHSVGEFVVVLTETLVIFTAMSEVLITAIVNEIIDGLPELKEAISHLSTNLVGDSVKNFGEAALGGSGGGGRPVSMQPRPPSAPRPQGGGGGSSGGRPREDSIFDRV